MVSQAFLIQLLVCLGLKDKPSKSIPPAWSVPFIGFIVNFLSRSVRISDERATLICAEIKHTLEKKWVSSMSLRSLASKLSFVSQAVLGGCTFSRWIFDACTSQGHKRPLSRATRADLNWWLKYLSTFNGYHGAHWAVFHPRAYLATNTSSLGAAGICSFPHAWVHAWTEKQVWHVNIKKLWAVSRSLELWAPQWDNQDIAVASNNAAVVSWINSGSARLLEAMAILRKIFWAVASHHLQLKAVWIPSTANIAANAGSCFQFDCLWAVTALPPSDILVSGPVPQFSLSIPSPTFSPSSAHHIQTLLKLKTSWDRSLPHVYSPLWPILPLPPTIAPGMPSFSFSWPTNGLPSWLVRNFLSGMLPGCGCANMPTPPSDLISRLFQLSTSPSELRSQWEKQIFRPWHFASREFNAACRPLSPKLTSPSTTWSVSTPLLTCTPLVTLPSGPLSAWVSSAFSDPGT
jgi:hypothetical protein